MNDPTYYIDGLLRQPSAPAARAYLGVNAIPGTGTVLGVSVGPGNALFSASVVDPNVSPIISFTLNYTPLDSTAAAILAALGAAPVPEATHAASADSITTNPITNKVYYQFRRHGAILPAGIGLSTLSVLGCAVTQEGTAAVALSVTNGVAIGQTTSAANNSVAGFVTTAEQWARRHQPRLRIRFRTGQDLTSLRYWSGCFSTLPTTTDDPVGHVAGLRYSTAAGDTTFRLITKDGVTLQNFDSGITPTTLTVYDFEIDMSDQTKIVYSINGAVIHTETNNLPTDTTDLFFAHRVVNGNSGSSRTFRILSVAWDSL